MKTFSYVRLAVVVLVLIVMAGSTLAGPTSMAPETALAGWVSETVDDANAGYDSSIDLDSVGYPHIGYGRNVVEPGRGPANRDLMYAYQDSTGWYTETVDSAGDVGQYVSLKIDAADYPHISYHDATNGDLKYAYKDGGGWHIETVDATNITGHYTSLALDSNGYPHISYKYATGQSLRYAYQDGTGWHYESPPAAGQVGKTALALNNSDQPRIAYIDAQGQDLYYGYRDGSGWHFSMVYDAVDSLNGLGFAVDAADRAYLAYSQGGGTIQPEVRFSYQDGGGWVHEVIVADLEAANYFALAVHEGTVHLSFGDTLPGNLYYGERTAVGWRLWAGIAGTTGPASYSSIAVTSAGRPHISYRDSSSAALRHAWVAGEWWTETVAGGPSSHVSLRYDSQGRPRACFYDATNQDLIYGTRNAEGWVLEAVDTEWDVGEYCSLVLDDQDRPHISYYYGTESDLRYAYKDEGGWHIEDVQASPSSIAGKWSSLALDASGYPHIAYYQETYLWLRYSYKDATGWHHETVDTTQAGKYASLVLTAAGQPRISYQREQGLYYAYKGGTGWQTEVAFTTPIAGETGRYTTLALSAEGLPLIAFADGSTSSVWRYAWKDANAVWQDSVIDDCEGQSGQWSTSILDAGLPYAVSVDEAGQLRYAYQSGDTWYTLPLTEVGSEGGYCSLATDDGLYQGVAYYNAIPQEVQFTHNNCLTVGVAPNPPVCVNTAATFDNLSFGVMPVNWEWGFGDGITSSLAYPTHTYGLAGSYLVTLTGTNECGMAGVGITQVISSTPTAGFDYAAPVCAGESFQFYNTTVGSATLAYTWTFGDGGVSNVISPTYSYANPGDYNCFLVASNGCGQDTMGQTVTAHGEPLAVIAWTPQTPTMGFPVMFTVDQTSTLPLTCEWDFGDGTLAGPVPCGPSEPITHTYATTGTFTVVVTATDACGVTGDTGAVTVVAAAPTAAFYSNAPVCFGHPVVFTNTSGGGEPLDFLWAFGDGYTSTLPNPTHNYDFSGVFTVVLTASNPYGESSTSSLVEVRDGVTVADFTWDPAWPAPGEQVTLTATTNGTGPVIYEWNLGDGITATGKVVVHTYATTDTYTVTLQAYNDCGGEIVAHQVDVSFCTAPSGLQVSYSPSAPLAGEVVHFTATLAAGSDPLTWAWDFGDGSPWGEGPVVTHTYQTGGLYEVQAAAWNDCGYVGPVSATLVVANRAYLVYLPLVSKSFCSGDAYEPDDTAAQANPLVLNAPQRHNFQPEGDEDWTYITLQAGQSYRFWTSDLAGGADPRFYLYPQGGDTPVAENDDWAAGNCGGSPPDPKQSCFVYTPATSGVYELRTNQYTGGAQWGCHVQYTLTAEQQ